MFVLVVLLTSIPTDVGDRKYNVILRTWMHHIASRNFAQAGEVCWAHHWYNAGRNNSLTSANQTIRRIPRVGFVLTNEEPAKEENIGATHLKNSTSDVTRTENFGKVAGRHWMQMGQHRSI